MRTIERRQQATTPLPIGGRRFLTIATIADRLECDRKTVIKLIMARALTATRFTFGWRIAERDFVEFLEREQSRTSQTAIPV